MTRWEYMSLRWSTRESFVSLMEEWGDKGWELAGVVQEGEGQVVLLLKRAKAEERRSGFGAT